jgi:uncharacterized protein (TIGR00288 family)
MIQTQRNMALFIDFDNIAIGFNGKRGARVNMRLIMERILEKGRIITKRAYADWHHYTKSKDELHLQGIDLIEIPKRGITGKNSADIRLVVDAIDLCHTNHHIDTFVIVSGDSDFSPLVSKLRENNKTIIGIGMRDSSSSILVDNCDEFLFYDDLGKEDKDSDKALAKGAIPKEKLPAMKSLVSSINALLREDTEILYGSLIKDAIKRKNPSFSESALGYSSFGEFLEDAQQFDVIEVIRDKNKGGTWVVTKLKGYRK